MKTILILGPQGSGKSTLAKAILKKPTYSNNQAAAAGEMSLIRTCEQMFLNVRDSKHSHTILCDEADVFFSILDRDERKHFKNYWAVARHRGLQTAVFIARRYIQIPIFVRASATQIYISADIRPGVELKKLESEGCEVVEGLPRGQFIFYRGLNG